MAPNFLKLQDDNHSETSGETNTSDSGRGLSDDETQNGKGVTFSNGKTRNKLPPLNTQTQNKSFRSFFPSQSIPLSPIDHPMGTSYPYPGNVSYYNPEPPYGSHSGYHDYIQTKSSLMEEDSGSTSGIHTMDEDMLPVELQGHVI